MIEKRSASRRIADRSCRIWMMCTKGGSPTTFTAAMHPELKVLIEAEVPAEGAAGAATKRPRSIAAEGELGAAEVQAAVEVAAVHIVEKSAKRRSKNTKNHTEDEEAARAAAVAIGNPHPASRYVYPRLQMCS